MHDEQQLHLGDLCPSCGGARRIFNRAGTEIPCPTCVPRTDPPPPSRRPPISGSLVQFNRFAEAARALIPPGKIDWSDSPFAWMRHNGPRTKSALGKQIVRDWLTSRGHRVSDTNGSGLAHFAVRGRPATVHFGVVGKEGRMEFSQLVEDGYGVEIILLLGIEPFRARIWAVKPEVVRSFPSWGQQVEGLHHCDFDPNDVPEWADEIAVWE